MKALHLEFPEVKATMATIYDVAQRAGVSITTVSRYLNDPTKVKQGTRRRIEEAIKELNYIPNEMARGLATRKSGLIAAVVPDIANPYFAEMVRGVQDVCAAAEYTLTICSTDGDPQREVKQVEGLISRRIDGVFLVRYSVDESSLDLLHESRIPVTLFGRRAPKYNFDTVGTHGTSKAVNEIVEHLVKQGRKHFAHIAGPSATIAGQVRREQFKQAIKNTNRRAKAVGVVEGASFSIKSGGAAMEKILSQGKPDAVFAANDLMAIGALSALEEQGLRVPEDVAVFGVDDIEMAAYVRPRLTSIAVPKYELGRMAAEMLIARINAPDRPRVQTSIEVQPVYRESTAIAVERQSVPTA